MSKASQDCNTGRWKDAVLGRIFRGFATLPLAFGNLRTRVKMGEETRQFSFRFCRERRSMGDSQPSDHPIFAQGRPGWETRFSGTVREAEDNFISPPFA